VALDRLPMPTLVNDIRSKKNPIIGILCSETEFFMSLIPQEEGTGLTIPDVVYALNPLVLQFMGPSIGESHYQ
jgi:hypothetical protein